MAWALVFPALLCAASCTGSLFRSKAAPPTIYVLSPGAGTAEAASAAAGAPPAVTSAAAPATAPAAAATAASTAPSATSAAAPAEIPVDLAILRPRLRPGLESDRIAVLYPDRRLDYFADARWSGPLGEVLQYFVVQEFHAHAHLRTVSADTSVFASAYWLEIEVTDFQAEYTSPDAAPTVHVRLLARLGTSGDRHLMGHFEAEAVQPAAQNRLTAIVDAYAHAADAAMAQIVAEADDTLSRNSEAR